MPEITGSLKGREKLSLELSASVRKGEGDE